MTPESPFPEIEISTDPKAVPWPDAVVWSERTADGKRVYEWINKKHVRTVSWTGGLVSIALSPESFLEKSVMYFIIQSPFTAVGKNMPV